MEDRSVLDGTHVSLRFVEHKQDPSLLVQHAVEDFVEDHLR